MPYGGYYQDGQVMNLQANLSAMTSMGPHVYVPHHPITCTLGELFFHEDGRFECEHAEAPPGDERTQAALDSTVAILLFEMLAKR